MNLMKTRTGLMVLSIMASLGGLAQAAGSRAVDIGTSYDSPGPINTAGGPCLTDVECDDGNACTDDICVAGICNHVDEPGCCTANADCDDQDECTDDECVDGFCVNTGIKGSAAGELLVVASGESDSVRLYLRHNGGFLRPLVSAGGGGLLNDPTGMVFGPDNSLYVSSFYRNSVLRVHWPAGGILDVFVPGGSGGLSGPRGLAFGPDGNLYVASFHNDTVLRYDGETGGFLGVFVRGRSGGLSGPTNILFGPSGHLYVSSFRNDSVKRYSGLTGHFSRDFVPSQLGGLDGPMGLAFGPDGNLYVSSFNGDTVNRYFSGGGFLNVFVHRGSGLLDGPTGLAFNDGELYVGNYNNDSVNRYSSSNGGFLGLAVRRFAGNLNGPRDVIISPVSTCQKSAPPDGPALVVNVTLDEFTVEPDRASVPAGRIRFHVSNRGTEVHEFLVIKSDLPEDDLPTEANGSYQENGPGTQILGDIDDIEPFANRNLTLDLEPGKYVLICNIVDVEPDGSVEAHYSLGMHAAFTVE